MHNYYVHKTVHHFVYCIMECFILYHSFHILYMCIGPGGFGQVYLSSQDVPFRSRYSIRAVNDANKAVTVIEK